MIGEASPLEPIEIASCYVFGYAQVGPLPNIDPGPDPVSALERAILPALQRPPCLVAFSGGRDSSAILALAARVARREGLQLPVPVTWRFPDHPRAEESYWQELLLEQLRLPEWIKLEDRGDLDFVGPVARRTLRRHGLLWSPNIHTVVPLLEKAAGGSLLTGLGGDESLGNWGWWRAAAVLRLRARPIPRDLLRVAYAVAPLRLRGMVMKRRSPELLLPWLEPVTRAAAATALARELVSDPVWWDRRTRLVARRRFVVLLNENLERLARDAGAQIVSPLRDRTFLASLAKLGGRAGFPSRTAAMQALFDGLLPATLVSRTSKAHFGSPYWGAASRQFTAAWTGGGVPAEIVDEAALRREWQQEAPDPRTALLLQSAWLASERSGLERSARPARSLEVG